VWCTHSGDFRERRSGCSVAAAAFDALAATVAALPPLVGLSDLSFDGGVVRGCKTLFGLTVGGGVWQPVLGLEFLMGSVFLWFLSSLHGLSIKVSYVSLESHSSYKVPLSLLSLLSSLSFARPIFRFYLTVVLMFRVNDLLYGFLSILFPYLLSYLGRGREFLLDFDL